MKLITDFYVNLLMKMSILTVNLTCFYVKTADFDVNLHVKC